MVRADYEKGSMAENAQASDILIAGNASAPDRPTSANRTKIMLVATLLGMFLTSGLLVIKEISEIAAPLLVGKSGLGILIVKATGLLPDEPSNNDTNP